jgi:hypothetical protein
MSKKQNSLKQIYTPWQPKVLVTGNASFMPNHVLVNRERVLRGKTPLQRSRTLDLVASMWAQVMASETSLFHAVDDIDALKELLQSDAVAENIQRGPSIQSMHEAAMEQQTSMRANILSRNFDEFGYVKQGSPMVQLHYLVLHATHAFASSYVFYRMGTARGSDGKIYMVQFFRRKPTQIDCPSPAESACHELTPSEPMVIQRDLAV